MKRNAGEKNFEITKTDSLSVFEIKDNLKICKKIKSTHVQV